MNILVIFIIIAKVVTINGNLWYKFVDCSYTHNGVICDPPRAVIPPYNYQPNNYLAPRILHPMHQPLSPNLAVFNQQPQMHESTSESFARSRDPLEPCSDEEFKCTSPHQCIKRQKLCDGHVNCVDGTDEENCSCVSKLDKTKICDNYYDCPNSEDETACGGCDRDSYSCHSNIENECYNKNQKCDNIVDCFNQEDETDYLLLTPYRSLTLDPLVRSTGGVLYLNVRNNWYPVCFDHSYNLALIVCEQELGVQLRNELINIIHEPTSYNGKYVNVSRSGRRIFVNKCSENEMDSTNHFVYVECPNVCGIVTTSINSNSQAMRITGDREAVSKSHPWMASLYLNGTFKCGGSIFKKRWIITAAHCVHHKGKRLTEHDYLQVRVGYNSKTLKNDIALLELSDALFYNRWVKPICLPSKKRIGNGPDTRWMWKPDVNTTCSTAGWGGFTDRGPLPVENLIEVELPIVSNCDPNNTNVTCAGYPSGGFDTCDSGGSLECRSDRNQNEFYLAGITSAGYNPTNNNLSEVFCGEPNSVTTFTKPSFYLDWVKMAIHHEDADDIWPSTICPGVICVTNGQCVQAYDGIVHCMYGEDEIKKL